jgi:mono/diheme cytochrome c family protein
MRRILLSPQACAGAALIFVFATAMGVARVKAGPSLQAPQKPDATIAAVDFARDIQPILEANCYECHGPKEVKARLRFDRRDSVVKGGVNGPPLKPGDSEHSLIVRRLLGLDGEDRMPLDLDPLPDAQIAVIRAWIEQGANWPAGPEITAAGADEPSANQHWAYTAPVRSPLPAVKNAAWARPAIG